jgi:hypothetical protein
VEDNFPVRVISSLTGVILDGILNISSFLGWRSDCWGFGKSRRSRSHIVNSWGCDLFQYWLRNLSRDLFRGNCSSGKSFGTFDLLLGKLPLIIKLLDGNLVGHFFNPLDMNAKLSGNGDLDKVIGEQNERLRSIMVTRVFVHAPHDMIEE